jgi:predicted alpha/beta hydrolase family esterase
MPAIGPAEEMKEEVKKQMKAALAELEGYKTKKLMFEFPTFFVPGWTGEDSSCWLKSNEKSGYTPLKEWIDGVTVNPEQANYVKFTDEESKNCESFLDFGKLLKKKIWEVIKKSGPVNLVGHSMGGLDITAAVIDIMKPVLKVNKCITIGTPHQGASGSKLLAKVKKYPKHHGIQCINLDPSSEPIKFISTLENRKLFLDSIGKLYIFMGLRDFVVRKGPKFDKTGMDKGYFDSKVKIVQIMSAEHTGKYGITQDPRAVLPLVKLLSGIEIKSTGNKGYIFRKK